MHQGKTGRIPEFVDKMPVAVHPFFRHFYIASLGGKCGQGVAEGIRPILIYDVQRVDDVAL